MFKSTIFSLSLSSCFSERFFYFICLKRLLVRDVLYGKQLALCNALPPPSQSSVPGAALSCHTRPRRSPHIIPACARTWVLWSSSPLLSGCGCAMDLLSVSVLGQWAQLCSWVVVCVLPPKHSKTTTPVNFLEINYFEGYYLNKRDKILPND